MADKTPRLNGREIDHRSKTLCCGSRRLTLVLGGQGSFNLLPAFAVTKQSRSEKRGKGSATRFRLKSDARDLTLDEARTILDRGAFERHRIGRGTAEATTARTPDGYCTDAAGGRLVERVVLSPAADYWSRDWSGSYRSDHDPALRVLVPMEQLVGNSLQLPAERLLSLYAESTSPSRPRSPPCGTPW